MTFTLPRPSLVSGLIVTLASALTFTSRHASARGAESSFVEVGSDSPTEPSTSSRFEREPYPFSVAARAFIAPPLGIAGLGAGLDAAYSVLPYLAIGGQYLSFAVDQGADPDYCERCIRTGSGALAFVEGRLWSRGWATMRELVDSGIESLTISLINSFANADHERRLKAIAQKIAPALPVTISSEVLPEFREYERALTAAMNAYVKPKVRTYVANLNSNLKEQGVNARLNILRSDAGLMTAETTEENPVYTLMSGPSGGVAGALHLALRAGFPNILTFDMGGTSTDVALCMGEPNISRETVLGYFPVKVPSVDVRSVGAGGGSIAHVPALTKALRVGPQSAGAVPGPACYSKGGTEPTVTDANVVCGYLPPSILGGAMQLDTEAAKAAVKKIAEATGLGLHQAAEGILKIVNENMFGALRLVSVQKGYDPREFALMAFGGAGPLHGNALAELLGSYPVIVPPAPGLLCALGDLSADFRDEYARTYIRTVDKVDQADMVGILKELGAEATATLEAEQIPAERQQVRYFVDLRYYRQGYEMPIAVDVREFETDLIAALAARFSEGHERAYGFKLDSVVEIVNLRAVGIGKVTKIELPEGEPSGAKADAAKRGVTQIYRNGEWMPATLYDRGKLTPGMAVEGPAIITELDSTTVVLPHHIATVDRFYNLLINKA